jgi:hypothetical protein
MVVGGPLFIAGGQAPKLFTSIYEALDVMAQAVEGAMKRPLVTFLLLAGDGDSDAMLARILANLPAAVPFITHDTTRSALGTAWRPPLDGTCLQELFEDRRFVALPRREDDGHELAVPFSASVDFGIEPAPAPAAWWWARIMVPST